ncbi:hypothetical protein GRS96_06335 [Rathayibacter sp. VKM Ac-2803]|uniref:hypothetical protein n=1 Tax=Rathayibacter sp. VKM Ac-2803 TaxID=2609256 RepID=UPI00135C6615|nr:hypothetical protein [Rathayibacter sp. VKM Ac-2803]MWV48895.1 hypothetical protein [Rathayibacter sp. VKM Ac-2803]
MEIALGLLGLLVAAVAGAGVVAGRRRAAPTALVDVVVRLAHAGDDWWRVTATVRNRGVADIPPTAFTDGRPITVAPDGSQAAAWYGEAPLGWSLDSAGSLVLSPTLLPRSVDLSATVVVRGRPGVRIDVPLRSVPVREEVVETAAPQGWAASAPAVVAPARRLVDAPVEALPVRETVLRGGFGVWAAMVAGVLGAVLMAVGIALSMNEAATTAVGTPGVILILVAVVGILGTLAVRLLRRWLEPPALWRTPAQRLRRPGTIASLVPTYAGVFLFCLEFVVQERAGDTTWVAGVGLVLLVSGGVTAAITGLVRLIAVVRARRSASAG